MRNSPNIGFIGAGNMATALIGGLLAQGWPAKQIWVSDLSSSALAGHRERGVHTTSDNAEVVANADVLLLAVKPQVMSLVLQPLKPALQQKKPLIISIAAGIPLNSLQRWVGGGLAIVRAMPNTPALVQIGATGLFGEVNADQHQLVSKIVSSVGLAVWVDAEAHIDAVTAVSGSGPAYFFYLMEAMIAAGKAQGLPEQVARDLALQTALGAAQMAITSDVPPGELRRRVTSPGGTTEQAIAVFEQEQMAATVERAMRACAERGVTLAQELGQD